MKLSVRAILESQMEFRDYYATLGVAKTATAKEIKQAYRKLARKYHPDVNSGDEKSEARFKEINEAHEVLGDPEKRRRYDQLGSNWDAFNRGAPGGGGSALRAPRTPRTPRGRAAGSGPWRRSMRPATTTPNGCCSETWTTCAIFSAALRLICSQAITAERYGPCTSRAV